MGYGCRNCGETSCWGCPDREQDDAEYTPTKLSPQTEHDQHIYDMAWERGRDSGYQKGYDAGKKDGEGEAYQKGYTAGYQAAKEVIKQVFKQVGFL